MKNVRKRSIAICGGAFGDEGKGRLVDSFVNSYAEAGPTIIYRDNGGSNAGHTVEFGKTRVALHQLPSGVFFKTAVVVLGKGMVLHPADLLLEMKEVEEAVGGAIPAKIVIDEMAALALDTHRAYETVLKQWKSGQYSGSTGRGISPAYADIIYRHPLRMRDLAKFDVEAIEKHYDLYAGLAKGLGQDINKVEVATLSGEVITIGSKKEFLANLKSQSKLLKKYVADVSELIKEGWEDEKTAFVFEKAQAIGLDSRWGVYPDVTASDTTIDGIYSSTEGVVSPEQIEYSIGVIKATYTSSVGSRKLPTEMPEAEAHRIREDANEYGATTGRPRGIVYLDIPMLRYFARVGKLSHLALTHMDVVYPGEKIKVCTGYLVNGKAAIYRPDQEYLLKVKPVYTELDSWDAEKLKKAKTREELPKNAQIFLEFIETEFQLPVMMITTGPERGAELMLSE